jgi:hypothetical protein
MKVVDVGAEDRRSGATTALHRMSRRAARAGTRAWALWAVIPLGMTSWRVLHDLAPYFESD